MLGQHYKTYKELCPAEEHRRTRPLLQCPAVSSQVQTEIYWETRIKTAARIAQQTLNPVSAYFLLLVVISSKAKT